MWKLSQRVSSLAQLCPTLCHPRDCSMPGLPVRHQLPEFTQTHVHWVGDPIQQSHPLSSPFPPTFNLSQHQVLSTESTLRFRWPKYWSSSFSISPSNEYSEMISLRMDWFYLLVVQGTLQSLLQYHGLVLSPCCPRGSTESSPIPQFKSINSLALSFLYSPTLTPIHDYWKNHSFD